MLFALLQQRLHVTYQKLYLFFIGAVVHAANVFLPVNQHKRAAVNVASRFFVVQMGGDQVVLFANVVNFFPLARHKQPRSTFDAQVISVGFQDFHAVVVGVNGMRENPFVMILHLLPTHT